MLKEEVIEKVKKYDIESKSIESFWFAFKHYKEEEKEEFEKEFRDYREDKMQVRIDSIAYKLGNWPHCDYNHIVVRVKVKYEGEDKGEYYVYFSLDGEVEDDYFLA